MVRYSKATISRKKAANRLRLMFQKNSASAKWRCNKINRATPAKNEQYQQLMKMTVKKRYYLVPKGSELKAITIGIIRNSLPLLDCRDLLIGSSIIHVLLKSTLTPRITHGYFSGFANNSFGKVAEEAVKQKFNVGKAPCYTSLQLPFICASPDFVIEDRIVEVKSSSKPFQISNRHILQVLVALEIFGLQFAEIHLYRTEGVGIPKTRLVEIIGIEKTATIFTPDFVKHAIRGYSTYIIAMLAFLKIFPTNDERCQMENHLSMHFKNTKPGKQLAPRLQSTILCRDLFGMHRYKDTTSYESRNKPIWSEASYNSDRILTNTSYYSSLLKNPDNKKLFCSEIHSNFICAKGAPWTTIETFNVKRNVEQAQCPPGVFEFYVLEPLNVGRSSYKYDDCSIDLLLSEFVSTQIVGKLTDDFDFINSLNDQ